MKRKLKIAGTIFLGLCSLACIILTVYKRVYGYFIGEEDFATEKNCYILCAIAYTTVFAWIAYRKPLYVKAILATIGSTCCMLEIFLVNNFLKFAQEIYFIGFNGISRYLKILELDFRYDRGWGKFRYAFVFFLQLCLFIGVIFLQSKSWRKMRKRFQVMDFFRYRFFSILVCMCDNWLYHLVVCYKHKLIGPLPVYEYCSELSNSFDDMYQLLYCIHRVKIIVLFDTLFSKFGDKLTKGQYIKYRKMFLKNFDEPLWQSCEKLDEKYDIKRAPEYRDARLFVDLSSVYM